MPSFGGDIEISPQKADLAKSEYNILFFYHTLSQTVLDALVPQLLKHTKEETKQKDNPAAAKAERETITTLGVSIKSLITGAESLAR